MSNTTELRTELNNRWDAAWDAMEEAIIKLNELNDLCYDESGEPLFLVPRTQAQVLEAKGKEMTNEIICFSSIMEPSRALPQLPLIAV